LEPEAEDSPFICCANWSEGLDKLERDGRGVAESLPNLADGTGSEVVEFDVDTVSVAAASLEDWAIAVAGLALRSTIGFVPLEVGSGWSCLTGWAAASLSQAYSGDLEDL